MNKEDLIKKWLNDEMTPAERKAFEQGEDFELNQAIIDGAKQFKASNFSTPQSFEELQSTYQAHKSTTKQLSWFKPILKIASILIVTLGIYFTFFNANEIIIETIASEQTTIELPDQSQVTLNAGSEIKYNKKDFETSRQLQLNGEAYFVVAKGETFDVVTSQGRVTVVGTEFNVKQRPDYFEVQCFEGIVKVSAGNYSKTLQAGNTFRLLNETFSQDNIDDTVPDWTKDVSSFKAIPLQNVIAELERQYDLKIILENVDSNRLFTGGFGHNNLNNALLSVTQPMELNYKTNTSNDVIIYGNKK